MSEMDQIMAMIRGGQPSQIGPQASQMGQPNMGQPQGFSGSAMSQRAPMMGGRPMPGNVVFGGASSLGSGASMPQRSSYGGYAGSYMPQAGANPWAGQSYTRNSGPGVISTESPIGSQGGGNYAGGSDTFDESNGGRTGAGAFQSSQPWGSFGSAQPSMGSQPAPGGMGGGGMGGIMQLIMQMMGRQGGGQGGMGQPQPMPQAPQAGIGQGSSLAQLAGRRGF